jgi:phosphoribosylanthranilate isomerase
MTTVKICGMRSPDDALKSAAAGADMLGFVFAPVKRQVSLEAARAAIKAVKNLRPVNPPRSVGVFVNDSLEHIHHTADFAGLDIIQLSGDEGPDFVAAIRLPVIKAIRTGPGGIQQALEITGIYVERVPGITFVFDSTVPGRYGGTGTLGDWKAAANLARRYPTILAGGLTPQNVAEAIRSVSPLAVDVSSGVETNGNKDADKITAFVRQAKGEEGLDEEG